MIAPDVKIYTATHYRSPRGKDAGKAHVPERPSATQLPDPSL